MTFRLFATTIALITFAAVSPQRAQAQSPNAPIDTVEALPAFLADDQARDPVTEAPDQHPIAAE